MLFLQCREIVDYFESPSEAHPTSLPYSFPKCPKGRTLIIYFSGSVYAETYLKDSLKPGNIAFARISIYPLILTTGDL